MSSKSGYIFNRMQWNNYIPMSLSLKNSPFSKLKVINFKELADDVKNSYCVAKEPTQFAMFLK